MVKQLAAIKFRSIINALTAKVYILILSILSYLYGLFIIGSAGVALLIGMGTKEPLAAQFAIALGGLFTLGWILLPVIFASQEGTLDPSKLTPYVSYSRRLAVALVLVTAVGMAGIYLLLVGIIEVISWFIYGGIATGIAALIGSLLGIAICWIWTRAVGAWAGRRVSNGRAGRDRSAILMMVLILVVIAPMGIWMPLVIEKLGETAWLTILSFVKWTPFGAPWALPLAVAEQDWGMLLALMAITLLTVTLGWWFFLKQLSPAMTGTRTKITPEISAALAEGRHLIDPKKDSSEHAHTTSKSEAPDYLPGVDKWLKLGLSNPAAAIAQRTQIYWLRDPRLSTQLLSSLFLVVMGIFLSKFVEITGESDPDVAFMPTMGLGMVILSAFLMGQVIGTLLQFDSTALWIEVSAGTRGRDDRAGRFFGSFFLLTAFLVVVTIAFGLFTGMSILNMTYLFCLLFLLFTGAAAATTIIGSQWVYPVQPPGTSPMSTKGTGQFMTTMAVSSLEFVASLVIIAIPTGLMAWGFFSNAGWMPWTALLAILWSIGVTYLGIILGGKIFDRSQVELLTKICGWPGHGASA